MACFKLKGPNGERWVAELEGYVKAPGEAIVPGEIKWNCGPPSTSASQGENLIVELDKYIGKGAGDWIKVFVAPVAKVLGKAGCASCEVRKVVTNAYAILKQKYGFIIAIIKMIRLYKLSLKDPMKAAEKLKEILL